MQDGKVGCDTAYLENCTCFNVHLLKVNVGHS